MARTRKIQSDVLDGLVEYAKQGNTANASSAPETNTQPKKKPGRPAIQGSNVHRVGMSLNEETHRALKMATALEGKNYCEVIEDLLREKYPQFYDD